MSVLFNVKETIIIPPLNLNNWKKNLFKKKANSNKTEIILLKNILFKLSLPLRINLISNKKEKLIIKLTKNTISIYTINHTTFLP